MNCHPAPKTDMFIGRYQHTVDPKGRLSIPARYRNALAQYEGNLIVVPNGQALEVYPYPEWERLAAAGHDPARLPLGARPPRGGGPRQGRDARRDRPRVLRDLGPHALRRVRARARRRDRVGLRAI